MPEEFNWDEVLPEVVADEALNNSDKTITVPANEIWKIIWIHAELITTDVVGNRVLNAFIRDPTDDEIYRARATSAQAASTTYYYEFIPGYSQNTQSTVEDVLLRLALPPDTVLPPSFDIRIFDSSAVDPNADDLIVQIMVKKRRVLGG